MKKTIYLMRHSEIISDNKPTDKETLDLREWSFGRFENEFSILMPSPHLL